MTRVGFLHTGPVRHGATRFGRMLADATPGALQGTRLEQLQEADVLHLQYARGLWTGLPRTTKRLVVTVHDLHEPLPPPRRSVTAALATARHLTDAHQRTLALLARRASVLVTASPEEAARLARFHPRRVVVVPLLVPPVCRERSTRSDRLAQLGFLHPRKGQHLAVEALPHLPGLTLTLAGVAAPGHEDYGRHVAARVEQLGLGDRVELTGWLEDAQLEDVALTARLALAPYGRIAASGSMSTLIACRTPILATATPYATRLSAQISGAVSTYTGDLADAIPRALQIPEDEQPLRAYAEAHSPARTAQAHAWLYQGGRAR